MRVRSSRRAALVAIAVAAWSAAALAEETGPGALVGKWVRDQRERDDTARDAAIARATESLSLGLRGIARGVMRRRMVPAEGYVVEGGAAPSIRNETTGEAVPLDGRLLVFEKDHELTSRVVAAGEIEQVWKHGTESHGITRWRLSSDGDRVVVSERVHDPHFDEPIEYSTTYRRAAP